MLADEKVVVVSREGKVKQVSHYGWFGQWAVTPCDCDSHKSGKRWIRSQRFKVTHIPTGLYTSGRICLALTEAIKTAKRIQHISFTTADELWPHREAIYYAHPEKYHKTWVPDWLSQPEPPDHDYINRAKKAIAEYAEATISSGL